MQSDFSVLPNTHFTLTLLTDDASRAEAADAAGIDRVGIDIERLNKPSRQPGKTARISDHSIEALATIGPRLTRAMLFARCNQVHAGTADEVESLLDYGVKIIMLPYFKTLRELDVFSKSVGGRARIVPLVETIESLDCISHLRREFSIHEFHFGLNDLSLEMGLDHFWKVFEDDRFHRATIAAKENDISFGIGGVARADCRNLPMAPTEIYRSLVQFGAGATWIARSFFRPHFEREEFIADIAALRAALDAAETARSSLAALKTKTRNDGAESKSQAEILGKLAELGAGEIGHVNGPLLSHLQGTRDLLEKWGNRETLCNAGLYHAAYGTAGFEPAVLDLRKRDDVIALIGKDAERIVYIFGACDRKYFYEQLIEADDPVYRDRFTGDLLRLAPESLRDLCELTLANELEILQAMPVSKGSLGKQLCKILERMTVHASRSAAQDYARLTGPSRRRRRFFWPLWKIEA